LTLQAYLGVLQVQVDKQEGRRDHYPNNKLMLYSFWNEVKLSFCTLTSPCAAKDISTCYWLSEKSDLSHNE